MNTTPIVKISSGFFYRTNNRHQLGLNWFSSMGLPEGIRLCKHAINLGQHFVENLPFEGTVEATIWLEHGNGPREFKGIFQMDADRIRWWASTNGFYTAKSGAKWLAVPTILWKVVKLPDIKKVESQLSLFTV